MKRVLFAFVFVLFAVCISAEDVKGEVTALLKEQDEAWNRGDLDGFLKYYDHTGKLVFIGSTGEIRDYQVLKQKYEKRYKTADANFGKLTFSDLKVEELSKGLVRAWGKWQVEQKSETQSGWFSLILRKTPEGWRIIHDHSS